MRSYRRNSIFGLIVTGVVFGGIFLYHEFGSEKVSQILYLVVIPVLVFSVIYWAVVMSKK